MSDLEQATEYLTIAVQTETGRDGLRSLYGAGASAIIKAPAKGSPQSILIVARALRAELNKRYGF